MGSSKKYTSPTTPKPVISFVQTPPVINNHSILKETFRGVSDSFAAVPILQKSSF